MAHNWDPILPTTPTQRHCSTCDATQTRVGHNWTPPAGLCTVDRRGRPATVQQAIQAALADGPLHRDVIAEVSGFKVGSVASALTRMRQAGKVRRVRVGVWELVEKSNET